MSTHEVVEHGLEIVSHPITGERYGFDLSDLTDALAGDRSAIAGVLWRCADALKSGFPLSPAYSDFLVTRLSTVAEVLLRPGEILPAKVSQALVGKLPRGGAAHGKRSAREFLLANVPGVIEAGRSREEALQEVLGWWELQTGNKISLDYGKRLMSKIPPRGTPAKATSKNGNEK